MNELVRLDVVLKSKYDLSRQKSKELILAGNVKVNGVVAKKCSVCIDANAEIEIDMGSSLKYVSRGGWKLEKAIEVFRVDIEGKICMDIGASTGGFTDCMLQKGAYKVFAIDVGSNQLVGAIKQNPKVISLENTNINDVTSVDIGQEIMFIAIDVSFVSLTKILDSVYRLLDVDGDIVALIKPQFEVGRSNVGKSGVVKESRLHKRAITYVCDYATNIGLSVININYSPIKGGNGNIEYLVHMRKNSNGSVIDRRVMIENCVVDANNRLVR